MHSLTRLEDENAVGILYQSYLLAALATSELESPANETNLARETKATMQDHCTQFLRDTHEILNHSGLTLEEAGHNFWLTRNGHGAGFWDRGLGGIGDALTAAACEFPEQTLYSGDDGKLYVC